MNKKIVEDIVYVYILHPNYMDVCITSMYIFYILIFEI